MCLDLSLRCGSHSLWLFLWSLKTSPFILFSGKGEHRTTKPSFILNVQVSRLIKCHIYIICFYVLSTSKTDSRSITVMCPFWHPKYDTLREKPNIIFVLHEEGWVLGRVPNRTFFYDKVVLFWVEVGDHTSDRTSQYKCHTDNNTERWSLSVRVSFRSLWLNSLRHIYN